MEQPISTEESTQTNGGSAQTNEGSTQEPSPIIEYDRDGRAILPEAGDE
mgnify:CR=1 FL=1